MSRASVWLWIAMCLLLTSSAKNSYTGKGTINAPIATLTCPLPIITECDISDVPAYANLAELQTAGGTFFTDCIAGPNNATFASSDASNLGSCPEIVTRTYSITTNCSETAVCNQMITITDITDPTIVTCPPMRALEGCTATDVINHPSISLPYSTVITGTTEAIFIAEGGVASDMCGIDSVHYVDAISGNCPITLTRTFTVFDPCGNSADCIQTIEIDDTTPPTADPISAIGPFSCYADIPAPDVTVVTGEVDNCGGIVTVAFVSDSADPGCNGTVSRTYSLTDVCGNTANITQDITIDDNKAPTADPISAIGPFSCYADIPAPDVTVVTGEMDDCGEVVAVAFVSDSPDPGCSGTVTRTYSLTDVCGNTVNITQDITIDDNTAPTADPISAIGPFSCYADIPAPDVSVVIGEMDDCGGAVTVAFVSDSANPGCSGTVTRTYSLTDVCGNSVNITQNITIDDNTAPTADPISAIGPFSCYADIPAPDVSVVIGEMDDCGGAVTVAFV
ncbi:HYR-like domain-containing protein, partial [Portibacter marinus]|uniref:HYR-like domain-containing protein n=1 Tax=Portibacter marinus TaxID=2898660 RepID=UPI001F3D4529